MKRPSQFQFNFLKVLLINRFHEKSSSSTGFTLIESLVAIIVVTITVVSISPPIFWAAGTRVQNRRAEQALSIAQGTIDEVRATVERGTYSNKLLPPIDAGAAPGERPQPLAPAPLAEWTVAKRCINPNKNRAYADLTSAVDNYPPITQYLAVDTDGDNDCTPEFLVQVFRNEGMCSTGPCAGLSDDQKKPVVFSVGVRVYSALAKRSQTLETEKARLTGTTGTGQAGSRPLAVLYATVSKSDSSTALSRYRDLCKASGGSKMCE